MNFFIRNVLLLHLFALALAFSWIHGGTRPDLLLPVVPWLTAFVLEFLLVFPQAKSTETLSEARSRVWHSLARDPLLYLSVALILLLVIPLFNVSGYPEYNAALKQWRNPAPPMPGLPFCVNRSEHAVLLLWFPPVLIAALAAKHGLLKKGKRLLLEGLCWNGAALAVLGFAQLAGGAKSVFWGTQEFAYFFSTFGYPNFAGAFFTLLFALSSGLWFGRVSADLVGPSASGLGFGAEGTQQASGHWLLIPLLLNLGAAIASLSRAAILLCVVVFVVLSLYMIIGVWQRTESGGHVKLIATVILALFVGGLSFTVFAPKALKTEIVSITPASVAERVSGRAQYHARVAKAIFRDHPVFGVGGWGYPHYLTQYLTPEERKSMQINGGANVHNDALQFLAEQGAVGFSLMALCVLMLAAPLVWLSFKMCRALAAAGDDATAAKPRWLYRLPPVLIAVFVGAAATVCHSLGDLPFRDPAIVSVWILAFVCVSGFLPAIRKN
ncbi:MAG TPA: O-antigen ligase family protein [Kiritimatiellia bacterium]|nr:O-antigen ligase family protein [Kiritimatiellia bacterium]HPS06857.1 O-antigen ligase family protein [Kiritimatiellia bacterium]